MNSAIVNAFTCSGAYAVLIMSGLKRVENRSCLPVPAMGRCALTVSKKFCRKEYDNLARWLAEHCIPAALAHLLKWDEVESWPGCIVATMDYEAVCGVPGDNVLANECRIWNEGYANWWILSNIRKQPSPIPCRGNVGMWRMPTELSSEIEKQCEGAAEK